MASKDLGMDMITKRPRTPRDPYTTLTDTQIKNLKRDPGAFFFNSKPYKPYPETGHTLDRYATTTNEHLLRGRGRTMPYCWIDYQWQRDPPQLHNTCRLGASERWGPDKVGNRAMQHFNEAENSRRFVNVELYRRQPTNLPGQINMAHGRPAEGYYALKYPNSTTWFGSSVPLNRTQILQDINPKTTEEYETIRKFQEERIRERKDKFPFFSEYTDKFAARTKVEPIMTTISPVEHFVRVKVMENEGMTVYQDSIFSVKATKEKDVPSRSLDISTDDDGLIALNRVAFDRRIVLNFVA